MTGKSGTFHNHTGQIGCGSVLRNTGKSLLRFIASPGKHMRQTEHGQSVAVVRRGRKHFIQNGQSPLEIVYNT